MMNTTGQHLLVTKGAAEGMLDISNQVEVNGKSEKLTYAWRERILNQINELNDDGLRVLLVGYKLNPAPVGEFSAKDENDLIIIGYLAIWHILIHLRKALKRLYKILKMIM